MTTTISGTTGLTANNSVFTDASGNVGIGTSSPYAKLHVRPATDCNLYVSNSGTSTVLTTLNDAQSAYNNLQINGLTLQLLTQNTERMRIDSSGNVLVTNVAGLGYGTGAGGTVTQATSKSTAVTLNKPTGQITMNNAALAAGASVSFALNNSLITAVDILTVNVTSFGSYIAQCVNTATGAATIRVTNITGGSLSEALTIQFAIIKGATS